MLTPCPNGRFAKLEADHCDMGGRYPLLSPGSSIPVRVPTPKARSKRSQTVGPSFCAIFRVPTLDDCARTPVAVYVSVGWYQASLIRTPPMRSEGGTTTWVFGVISFCCSAAAKVIDFWTEPGSKADMTGGFM